MEIALGDTVKDKTSPFTGKVTGRAEYLNSATMVQVTNQDALGDDGKPIQVWIEETSVDGA